MTLGLWFLAAQLVFLTIQIGGFFWMVHAKDKTRPLVFVLLMMVCCLMSGAIGTAMRKHEKAQAVTVEAVAIAGNSILVRE